MDRIELPLVSRWAVVYTRRKNARQLDLHRVYADGEIETWPMGEVNLDHPFKLLHPEAKNQYRPSDIAMTCKLFGNELECYRLMRLVEDDIYQRQEFSPSNAYLYLIGEKDSQGLPSQIHRFEYGEALALLSGQRQEAAIEMPSPKLDFRKS